MAYEEPADPAVRWDSGVTAGSVVGVDFDPMLAKVVAHGPTRAEAAGQLALALERLHLGGVVTNRAFLAETLRTPEFLAGDTTTDFIDRVDPPRSLLLDEDGLRRAAVSAALWMQGDNRVHASVLADLPSGWRNSPMPPERVVLRHGGDEVEVPYQSRRDGTFAVGEGRARVHAWSPGQIDLELDGRRTRSRVTAAGASIYVQVPNGTVSFEIVPRFLPPGTDLTGGGLHAPMPGSVLEVRCVVGDEVEAGQVLVVLEAMKMEHHVRAPVAGVVREIRVAPGDQVDNGATLLVIDDGSDEEGDEA